MSISWSIYIVGGQLTPWVTLDLGLDLWVKKSYILLKTSQMWSVDPWVTFDLDIDL